MGPRANRRCHGKVSENTQEECVQVEPNMGTMVAAVTLFIVDPGTHSQGIQLRTK